MEKSPLNNNDEEPKKKERKKRVQPIDGSIETIVQQVVEKLKPEINKMYGNLKKENQNELRQLRFDIETLRPAKPTTSGINSPAEIVSSVSKIDSKNLLNDPEVQKLLNQFKGLQGVVPSSVPAASMQQVPVMSPQQNGLMGLMELMKMLGGNQGGFGGGSGAMGEMMVRSFMAQQNRQTFLYDQLTKQLLTKLGAAPEDVATMQKTSDALMDPLKHHGDAVEAAKS